MALDVELYRRTIYAPLPSKSGKPPKLRRISVIDIHPEGATRTLVFVHGYGGRVMQWVYQLRFFGQSMRVIAPDLRGHGQSDDPDALPQRMDDLVDDLDLVLDRLDVRGPFSLIAHSFGGAVAAEYALRHPERVAALVLIAVPNRFILRPGVRQAFSIPAPLFNAAIKRLDIAIYAPVRTLRRMHDAAMSRWRGDERLALLRVPTLVMLGQRDRVFSQVYYTGVARSIPAAQQVVIPVSAHLVQLERPDAVNRSIRRFIDAKDPRPSVPAPAPYMDRPWLQYYDNEVPEQVPQPKQPLHDLLSSAAHDHPDRPALIFFGQRIGYRELDLLSKRFAHALRALGVRKGDRVAIVLPNVPQCVIAFFGSLKAGAVVVLGSPLSSEEEIAYQLRDAGARVLLTLTSYRPVVGQLCAGTSIEHIIYTDVREYLPLRQRVLLASLIEGGQPSTNGSNGSNGAESQEVPIQARQHSFQSLLRGQPADSLDSGVTADDLALLQYTSGTTDVSRGVMLTHGNLLINVVQHRHWMPNARRGREVLLCVLPLSHSYGITSAMNLAVALASSLVLMPTRRTDQIVHAIKDHHPSLFPGVPALYLAIANYPHVRRYGVASIRYCLCGSAPLPVEVQEAFEKLTRGRLVEGYGLTEASPVTHCNPLQGERRVGSIGIPYPGTDALIVDAQTGEPLPTGEVGELLIRGPQVMRGYWNRPDETAQALRDGWLHTGDLARMDEDGFFTIVDRKKDIILSGPYNVYPRDVEEVLYEHPKVLEAAVVGATTAKGGPDARSDGAQSPFVKAIVVLKRGEKATAEELLALCRERLDAYKVPRQIEFRTELPKNVVGKVLRRLLIEP